MFKSRIKIFAIFGFAMIALCFVFWLGVKHIIVFKAGQRGTLLIEEAYRKHSPQNEDERLTALAREVFENFEHKNPDRVFLLRIARPYLTNRLLPEFIRLPDGIIETLLNKGFCDNASRMLSFILDQEGFNSVQWNMLTERLAHSALLVTMSDGRKVLLDSFYGYATVGVQGKLIHPREAKKRIDSGARFEDVFLPLGDSPHPKFYKKFHEVNMEAEGEDFVMETILPAVVNEPIFFGAINKSKEDVFNKRLRLLYWNYMGHKYNRNFIRILKATTSVRISITLLLPPDAGVIISDRKPFVDGNTLSWDLQAGEAIIFRDGLAKRSFVRFNSYIDIDQIALHPLEN